MGREGHKANFEGSTAIEGVVLIGAQFRVTDVWFECFIFQLKFAVADKAVLRANLDKDVRVEL